MNHRGLFFSGLELDIQGQGSRFNLEGHFLQGKHFLPVSLHGGRGKVALWSVSVSLLSVSVSTPLSLGIELRVLQHVLGRHATTV